MDKSSNRSLTNSATVAAAKTADDFPKTFAAIGSTLDKTNSQMTSQRPSIIASLSKVVRRFFNSFNLTEEPS